LNQSSGFKIDTVHQHTRCEIHEASATVGLMHQHATDAQAAVTQQHVIAHIEA